MDNSTVEYAMKRKDAFYIDETNSKSGPVVRWISNDRIPFEDMLETFVSLGYISQLEQQSSLAHREIEDGTAIKSYRENFKGYDSETLAEIRAAFGAGVNVVNVLTGHEYTTN